MKRVAIIQARCGSKRLPEKVLLDIGGKPMLQRVIERTQRATQIDEVIVATTVAPEDEAIVQLCRALGVPVAQGSVLDVLDRFYRAARDFRANVVVRITADCPLIDPAVIDQVVKAFWEWGKPSFPAHFPPETGNRVGWDFAANRLPPPWKRTYPIGLDVEVCTFQALERAWREATKPYHREHVMPYIYEEERSVHVSTLQSPPVIPEAPPGFFRVLRVDHDPDYGSYRWTVDTPEDLQLVRQIYAHFGSRSDFSWLEVLDLFKRHPELAQINASVPHKAVHEVDERLVTKESTHGKQTNG
ncbi:MAG: glycosyltransferase family protein [Anaerolineales bacterium]|nr:glycosyltransferase family protein [Anaerolineales bacterium]MDW8162268.1 glycosyltransferase family protein [Anaerolineales bacterium]